MAGHTNGEPLKDPVCGMTVTVQSPHFLQHDGTTVYFCCAGCKNKFATDPSRYLRAAASAPVASAPSVRAAAAAGTIYTCPMHPEVLQDKPGICPKCGIDAVLWDGIIKINKTLLEQMAKYWFGDEKQDD